MTYNVILPFFNYRDPSDPKNSYFITIRGFPAFISRSSPSTCVNLRRQLICDPACSATGPRPAHRPGPPSVRRAPARCAHTTPICTNTKILQISRIYKNLHLIHVVEVTTKYPACVCTQPGYSKLCINAATAGTFGYSYPPANTSTSLLGVKFRIPSLFRKPVGASFPGWFFQCIKKVKIGRPGAQPKREHRAVGPTSVITMLLG